MLQLSNQPINQQIGRPPPLDINYLFFENLSTQTQFIDHLYVDDEEERRVRARL